MREASSGTAYLPGLDGMRALGVLAVMALHGGLPLVARGGYLGVDIFFVISGFLITSILLGDMEQCGKIRFLRFYAHRYSACFLRYCCS